MRKSLPKCGWPFPSPVRPTHFQKKRALRATTHASHHLQKNRALRATHPRDVPIFKNSRAARDPPADHHAQTKKTRAARDHPRNPPFSKKSRAARDPPARPTHATCPFSTNRALRTTHPRTTMLKPKKSRAASDPPAYHHVQTKKIARCARPTCKPPCATHTQAKTKS